MGPETIVIADRSRAGKILSSPRQRAQFAYLVSIGAPMEREPAGFRNIENRLRLLFEDTMSQEDGGPISEDVERIINFARKVDIAEGSILVQCEAGISRSSAGAIIVAAVILGPGRELAAVRHVLSVHPVAQPNRRMLELADEVLSNGGAIITALQAVLEERESRPTTG
jgi:predicted protein tyrosine phosphatase